MIPRWWRTLVLLASVLWAGGCDQPPGAFRGTALTDVSWGQDFVLTAASGERFDTHTLRGRVQVVFFGYTHCPDICAPTLTRLAEARQRLGVRAREVQVLFITVDPERDTPAELGKFLGGFDADFIGLTGSPDEVRRVAAQHMAPFERGAPRRGEVAHTGTLYLKDRHGRLRVLLRETAPLEDLVHDLRRLIDA